MRYIPKLQKAWNTIQRTDAVQSFVPRERIAPIPLTPEQIQTFKLYGSLNKPEVKQTYLSQGKKKTVAEQQASNKKLAEQEKLQNYQKQKEQDAKNLERAAEVAPYVIPGIAQAMWAGVAVDLATNKLSKDKYKSWGDMVDKNVGGSHGAVDKFAADLINPGYYAGAVAKLATPLIKKGIQNTYKINPWAFKPIPGSGKFQSEIDWGKWNSEIPSNKPLMQEYHAIEQTAKQNGTWMKNSDGSAFSGTPEQFVQQRSKNFKNYFKNSDIKDYHDNPLIVYNSSYEKFNSFDPSKSQLANKSFYFASNLNKSREYGNELRSVYLSDPTINMSGDGVEYIARGTKRPSFGYQGKDVDIDIVQGGDEYIVRNPNVIKSAIGNNGMFDMTNSNIYKGLIPAAGLYGLYGLTKNNKKINN